MSKEISKSRIFSYGLGSNFSKISQLVESNNHSFLEKSTNTFFYTAELFSHCPSALESFKYSLSRMGGLRVKDKVGRIFYVKIDTHQKTTLNINEQCYGDLSDVHFQYITDPSNQIKHNNGWTTVNLPCIANFKDQVEFSGGDHWMGAKRVIDEPKKLEKLINKARRVCPFPDFKQKRKKKSKSLYTAQQ